MELTKQTAAQLAPNPISLENLAEREPPRRLDRIAVCYPSGNTTAVIFDQLSDYNPKTLNREIMRAWASSYPNGSKIEQCCIISASQDADSIARVEMLGGEFCGNATRSALWLLTGGQRRTGLVEASGVNRPLVFSVRDKEVMLEMPLPQNSELVRRVAEGWLVQLDGITQLVTIPETEQAPRQILDGLLGSNKYRLAEQPAVGVSSYDEISRQAAFCVWVKEVDTTFDETACGSGTSAIGIARAWEAGSSVMIDVLQPSGEIIQTEATYGPGAVKASFITGSVRVLYDGALKLS